MQLGERDRQGLYMRHINGAGVGEVANSLGLTEGSTRVLLTRARERLRIVVAGLGSFIPWSWRRWFREHVPTVAPSLEVLVVAVAVGIAGGFTPPAAEASNQGGSDPQRVERAQSVQEPGRPLRAAAVPSRAVTVPAGATHRDQESGGDARATGSAASQPEHRVLDSVRDSVTVRREYPTRTSHRRSST